ncbi:MAG: tRNA (N(6)-L-threonylcarbamoyladenosine(37)-C(2))-methylthiotransferase MtaB [Chloroflexi bacterium]|nr:tRNA (N(6)-L-threonylcarbamoyladenosine(37)-C(2))-methylthiotransferase MtaB [Chloroflexota bacterium]
MPSQRRPSVFLETHGCKLNQADTQSLLAQFMAAGYVLAGGPEAADVYVVNTCTVTHEADAKARQALRNARRANANALVVATGCYAQRDPSLEERIPSINLVLGNSQKDELVARVSLALGPERPACSTADGSLPQAALNPRTRAMVKIQEGCNHVCSYCIVPKVRGRERSVSPAQIVSQVQGLVAEGYREVVLTGTQLGSYGYDLPNTSLERLIERILEDTSIARLRVSSLQPREITPELVALWRDPRLCPHVHIPLQSGSAEVLRRMRRQYTPEQYRDAVARVREAVPDVAVTADVIVGFPGETEDIFAETYALCEAVGFAGLHVFPYSARPGTSAARFEGQVEEQAKRRWMGRLLSLARAQAASFRDAMAGSVRSVLWEDSRPLGDLRVWSGLTDNYVRANAVSQKDLHNQIAPVLLERRNGDVVWGRLA